MIPVLITSEEALKLLLLYVFMGQIFMDRKHAVIFMESFIYFYIFLTVFSIFLY